MDEIEEFFEFKESEGLRPRTLHWYRSHVDDFVDTMEIYALADWTPRAITKFLHLKRQTCNPTTMNMYWRVLTYVSRWLFLHRHLDEDITPRVPRPRYTHEQKQGFSVTEVREILDAAHRTYFPLFNAALVLVLYDTGMRAGELCTLRIADVDVEERQLTVRGKTGVRTCPIGKRALRAVRRYIRQGRRARPNVPYVFVTRDGAPITPAYLSRKVGRLVDSSGIERRPYMGPHAFRHGFALQFLLNGGDVLHLQAILGHRSVQMTEKYVRLLPRHLQQPHAKFSPVERM